VQHLDQRNVVQPEMLAATDQDLVRRRDDVDLRALARPAAERVEQAVLPRRSATIQRML
jgi:hypothetical protein